LLPKFPQFHREIQQFFRDNFSTESISFSETLQIAHGMLPEIQPASGVPQRLVRIAFT
jgi:hypothetical protein